MMKYDYLSIEQLRSALDHMEANYSAAKNGEAYGLADAMLDKITGLANELAHRFDPYTSAADVRFFESQKGVSLEETLA
jgi:hypothetical protein